MKINETNTTAAEKLTLSEIAAMPRKADLYFTKENEEPEDGILWHEIELATIVDPGMYGRIIVVSKGGYRDFDICDDLLDDPTIAFWNREPDHQQLKGVSEDEFNTLPEGILLKNLSRRITSEKMTFETFCRDADLDLDSFTNAMTGNSDFTAGMVAKISKILNLIDGEMMDLFTVKHQDEEPVAPAVAPDPEPENPMTKELAKLTVKLFQMPEEKSKRLVPLIWNLINNYTA